MSNHCRNRYHPHRWPLAEANKILAGNGKKGEIPELWDGKAAERIVEILWEREGE